MKAARLTKTEMEMPAVDISPSDVFAQTVKKHGRNLKMKDIKTDLRNRF